MANPNTQKKIAVLYICTGKYVAFWEEFYQSAKTHFLPGPDFDVHYFVFTDAGTLYGMPQDKNIHIIAQNPLGWPYDTLKRFEMFLRIEDTLRGFDYAFFFNANAEFTETVTAEMFLPRAAQGESLLFVQHPGYYNKPNDEFTYDRNPKSTAYIPYGKGSIYVCGGVNGGTAAAFLALCHALNDAINKDLSRNVIALFHDESQLNRYILDRQDYRLLTPAYCSPEGWELPFPCIVRIRSKARYFDAVGLRSGAPESKLPLSVRIYNRVQRTAVRLARRWREAHHG